VRGGLRRPRASAVPCPGAAQNCRRGGTRQLRPKGSPKVATLHLRGGAGARAGPVRPAGVRWCGGVPHLPLREAQARRGGLGTARLRSVRCGAGCGTRCGARARGRAGGGAAARGGTDGSRLARPRRVEARRGPGPPPWSPGAAPGAAHSVVRARLGRRLLAAGRWMACGWAVREGVVGSEGRRARAPLLAAGGGGLRTHAAPARRHARSWRHEGAL